MGIVLPVTVFQKVKRALADGACLEVLCTDSAVRKGSLVSGKWEFILRTTTSAGEPYLEQVVVSHNVEPLIIGSVNGLANYARRLGVTIPEIPLNAGDKGVWRHGDAVVEGSSE